MKQSSKTKTLVALGVAVVALMLVSAAANAQGVLFVKNGRVGIGQANPQVPLHISDPSGLAFAGMGVSPGVLAGDGFNFGFAPDVGGGFFNTRPNGLNAMNIMTSNFVRMRLRGDNGFLAIGASVNGVNAVAPIHHVDSGAVLTAGGVWQNASSRALKEDIAELSAVEAINTLRDLSPVTYRYKAEPEEQYVGFIAEDVPEMVASNGRKNLSSMDVVAVLTKVVQEQQTTIEALSRRLAELEAD